MGRCTCASPRRGRSCTRAWSSTRPAGGAGPTVRADVAGAGAAMARYLRDLGHRELVVLSWPGAGERLEGARAAWGGDDPVQVYTVTTERLAGPTVADGETAARVALGASPRPRAILALSDLLARGAMDAARRMGLSVPRDVSIVGIDDLEGNDVIGLTSVFVPYRPMGELAGVLLVGPDRGARSGGAAAPAHGGRAPHERRSPRGLITTRPRPARPR